MPWHNLVEMFKNINISALSPKVFCVAAALFFSGSVWAQSFWTRTYGGMNEDAGHSLVEAPDSGYLVVGMTGSFGNGASDAYILKTDSLGQFQWFKTYGGANVDIAQKVITASNGYFVAGYSNSGNFDYDFWMLRLDQYGDTVWTRKAGGADWDRAYSAVSDQNGAYIVSGESYSGALNQFADGMLLKIDDAGNTVWTKYFSLPGNDALKDVVRISPTRYAAVGTRENVVSQTTDGFVLFFDEDGNFLDTVYYDNGYNEHLNCMAISTLNGDMMLGGYFTYDTTNFPKSIQIKIDSLGAVDFSVLAPIPDEFGMEILSYGYYNADIFFFCGRSAYKSSGDHQAVVLKSWDTGYPEWLRTYGTIGPDDGAGAVIKTYDNGFLAAGFTRSYGPGTQALLLYKISSTALTSSGTSVAIKENDALKADIFVFPNPSSDQMTFRASSTFSLRLMDANGRQVTLPAAALADVYTVNLSHLAAGFYFAEMRFADGSAHVEKIYISK